MSVISKPPALGRFVGGALSVAATISALISCSADVPQEVVGTWTAEQDAALMILYSDGTVELQDFPVQGPSGPPECDINKVKRISGTSEWRYNDSLQHLELGPEGQIFASVVSGADSIEASTYLSHFYCWSLDHEIVFIKN